MSWYLCDSLPSRKFLLSATVYHFYFSVLEYKKQIQVPDLIEITFLGETDTAQK